MAITYKDTKNFSAAQLERLFLSVDWESGHYPEKLVAAMQHSDAVYSAWDGDRLVVDLAAGTIENQTQNKLYHFVPMPQRLLDMLEAGGLVATLEQRESR